MQTDRTYYVTTNPSKDALHTDKGCTALITARGIREAKDWEIDEGGVCGICSGSIDHGAGNDWDHQNALREAARNAD